MPMLSAIDTVPSSATPPGIPTPTLGQRVRESTGDRLVDPVAEVIEQRRAADRRRATVRRVDLLAGVAEHDDPRRRAADVDADRDVLVRAASSLHRPGGEARS